MAWLHDDGACFILAWRTVAGLTFLDIRYSDNSPWDLEVRTN
jgi:hypothetical protein